MNNNSDHATENRIIRIAVDVMGGDFAPDEIIRGAIEAARIDGLHIMLVGSPKEINPRLQDMDTSSASITVVPSEGKISEDEHPLKGLRDKPNASISISTGLVASGKADAMVSMGSTGAAMASATLGLGLLGTLDRPCIGGPFVALAPHTAILDLGSNIDCRPHQLLSFAIMGCVFARQFFQIEHPTVALLSVGSESAKGNRQIKETYPLFEGSHLNFIGNIEGMDLLSGKANVVVCDGFIGNILLKFAEGLGSAMATHVKTRLSGKLPEEELEYLSNNIWIQTNMSNKMSGPLFGVNGNVIIGHGASKSAEVAGAIDTAKRCVELDLVHNIEKELALIEEAADS